MDSTLDIGGLIRARIHPGCQGSPGETAGVPSAGTLLLLALLGQVEQALQEGSKLLLDRSADRLELLLVLAEILQRQYRWRDAARLQEQALRLATSGAREESVRHHTGLRLVDEDLYRDAAAEF